MGRRLSRGLVIVAAGFALAAGSLAGTAGAAGAGRSPGSQTFTDRLYGVAALSRSDAWAVGLMPSASLILHWNGRAWSKSLSGHNGYYLGVGGDSASDVWAVGGTSWFRPSAPLAEHWTGTGWTQVPSADPAGGGLLSAVTAISPDDAWAVGLVGPGPGIPSPTRPLIEHWDGKTWTITRLPEPAGGGSLHAVSATSATDVWAVGQTGPASEGNNHQTLIEHWNGSAWARVPSPDAAGGYNVLNGVSATSYRSAWAVGATGFAGHDDTLTEHWNGHAWTVVPSPTPDGDAQVVAVSATRGSNAWAVGMARGDNCDPRCVTVIEHWNGSAWTQVPSPNSSGSALNGLFGVSATGRHNAWAVGTIGYSRTLMAHWNGKTWS
jgi:hypothetical protein